MQADACQRVPGAGHGAPPLAPARPPPASPAWQLHGADPPPSCPAPPRPLALPPPLCCPLQAEALERELDEAFAALQAPDERYWELRAKLHDAQRAAEDAAAAAADAVTAAQRAAGFAHMAKAHLDEMGSLLGHYTEESDRAVRLAGEARAASEAGVARAREAVTLAGSMGPGEESLVDVSDSGAQDEGGVARPPPHTERPPVVVGDSEADGPRGTLQQASTDQAQPAGQAAAAAATDDGGVQADSEAGSQVGQAAEAAPEAVPEVAERGAPFREAAAEDGAAPATEQAHTEL